MPQEVTAKNGDSLCNLAVAAGFFDCQALRDEPKNSAFLTRPLQDGDVVTIPDPRPRVESGGTDRVHAFVLRTAPPVSVRFVHGSKAQHYLDDATLDFLNVSTYVTNLGGKDGKAKFPDQFEFHEEGDADLATFKIEVVDPQAGGSLDVTLEALKPVLKPNSKTVDHVDTFDGAPNAALRKIPALHCLKVRSGVAYRSKYMRLVSDELDKNTVLEQTLLVSDVADGQQGANDAVEILDQQVRATYVIKRCPGLGANKCAASKQIEVGHNRKRVRVAVHVFKSAFIAIKEQEIRLRLMKWMRRIYAQANVAPKFVAPEVEFLDPPPNNMLVISEDSGNFSAGFNKDNKPSTLSFELRIGDAAVPPNFTSDARVSINLKPSIDPQTSQLQFQTPSDVGSAIQAALPAGYKADVFTNPTAFNAVFGSCDVVITRTDGKIVDIPVASAVTDDVSLTVAVVALDIDKVVTSEGKDDLDLNGLLSCTPEIRRVVRVAPTKEERLDIYVVGNLVKRTDRNQADRDSLGRGTTIIPAKALDSDLQPKPGLAGAVLVPFYVIDGSDSEPFVVPHEGCHALMDASHTTSSADDFDNPAIASQLMFFGVAGKNAVDPKNRFQNKLWRVTKRLGDDPMILGHDVFDATNPRSRKDVSVKGSEVGRLRDKGGRAMEDW